ncbi:hypothetical protein G9P44_002317 [Scheffersomyces stipitis]|nr:hypothetical protein G9P44_002317 [Scheffersomyces stipitis]
MKPVVLLNLAVAVLASVGDQLPEFQNCLEQCYTFMSCPQLSLAEQIEFDSESKDILQDQSPEEVSNEEQEEAPPLLQKRAVLVSTGETPEHSKEEFSSGLYDISPLSPFKSLWDCEADCNYKCQQIITDKREKTGLNVVQFYGKWPFVRVWGIQEFFSTIFSLGNFYVNYINLSRLIQQYHKNSKLDSQQQRYSVMVAQYIVLIIVSLFGWIFSSIFHLRDNSITETMDYFGASAIIMSNFNAITMRTFKIFKKSNSVVFAWQSIMVIAYIFHCTKLTYKWDYQYNTNVNLVLGLAAMTMWCILALKTRQLYKQNYIMFNNSIQLLPFETKLLTKLNHIGLGQARWVPLLPIFFNLWLLLGISFEFFDWVPWLRLVDAHCLWHFFTIWPTIFWYDWNIWDIEMMKITDKAQRLS